MDHIERYHAAAEFIRSQGISHIDVCVVLGTGLSGVADLFDSFTSISYADIPGFPQSTVGSHKGMMRFVKQGNMTILFLQGRFHVYEGYSVQDVVIPVRTARLLGATTFFVTNACGGVGEHLNVGDIMLITDHINLSGDNPLIGKNIDELGERFPVMNEVYDKPLRDFAHTKAAEHGIVLKEGVYVWFKGPSLETPAEYRLIKAIGGDVVGMSTVPEVIAAKHAGMRIAGFSIVTNAFNPNQVSANEAEFETVVDVASKTGKKLGFLLAECIKNLDIRV